MKLSTYLEYNSAGQLSWRINYLIHPKRGSGVIYTSHLYGLYEQNIDSMGNRKFKRFHLI